MNGPAKTALLTLPVWTNTRRMLFRFFFLFAVLFIISLPFPHPLMPDLPSVLAPFFEKMVKWTGDHILKINHPYSNRLISDSTGLYIHLVILLFFSFTGCIIWSMTDKRKSYHILSYWFRVGVSYYLAFYLMSYGFNKLFKWQFYMPEPNTLFTTLGNTYRDLLYWSTMGTSRSYNIFLGSLELLAGLLLLFRKTRLLGALLAISILLNIVAVNFGFDINVKVFSCFLLFLAIRVAGPSAKRLYQFFFTDHTVIPVTSWEPQYVSPGIRKTYFTGKILLIAYMLCSLLSVYARSGNFNDDKATRPLFHGAYDVSLFIKNGDTLPPLTTDTQRWKRVFIHRRGYLIIQSMDEQMHDFHFACDTLKKEWQIETERDWNEAVLQYRQTSDTTINLRSKTGSDSLNIYLLRIDLTKLPLLQKEFNWTVDQ